METATGACGRPRANPTACSGRRAGNRREAICPPCAERYRQDAYQLISAGLKGGKGVPDTIAQHPAVFLTLTAPSFGVVHTRRFGASGRPLPCRARRDEPLCPRCLDYGGAVTCNNSLGALWRYTTIYVPRAMAHLCGMTQVALAEHVKPSYVKVAEYQRLGLVHLHVLARLDRAMPDYRAEQLRPPSKRFDVELLEHAIRQAVADVSAPVAAELGSARVRWGDQVDVRRLQTGEQRGEIAGYLAKYATKSTEQAGGLLHRVDPDDIKRAPVREHVRRYLRTAFDLNARAAKAARTTTRPAPAPAADVESDWNSAALAIRARRGDGHPRAAACPPAHGRRADWAHHSSDRHRVRAQRHHGGRRTRQPRQRARGRRRLDRARDTGSATRPPRSATHSVRARLRYRGHCLTKSRRYSTSFKALREARQAFVHAQILARSGDATQRAIAAARAEKRIASFEWVGTGHVTAADAFLAASAAARAREHRRLAREERVMGLQGVRATIEGGT
jgi:hypothetical protein